MQDFIVWLEAYADKIEGLTPSRSLLPQLDLFTDNQFCATTRSMDPLTGKE